MVQVPDELTQPVPVPDEQVTDNDSLARLALKLRAALEQANRQISAIREINKQP
jgi:hypothetical protein